jgi:type II secretory pathway predicted ATPase ExeA
MYESRWGLLRPPFGDVASGRIFHETPAGEEALARLDFLVETGRRCGLLVGRGGVGKSRLLEVFARRMRSAGHDVAAVSLQGADARVLLWQLAARLGSNPATSESTFALWRRVSDRLQENRYTLRKSVLLLDDADDATAEALSQVTRLAQDDPATELQATLVLTVREDRLNRLGRRLLELADLRIDVPRWEEIDTRCFLHHAIREAGRREPLFTEQAIALLHELSSGVARRVRQLAELALLAGAGQNVDRITPEIVQGVCEQLSVNPPPRLART